MYLIIIYTKKRTYKKKLCSLKKKNNNFGIKTLKKQNLSGENRVADELLSSN